MIRERFKMPDTNYPSTITELADIKDYMDTLAAFIAEKTGLVVRTDWNVFKPDYAPNIYAIFFAEALNSTVPTFCLYNTNSDRTNFFPENFYITNCVLVGTSYRPADIEGSNYSGKRPNGTIGFHPTLTDKYLQRTVFADGRKVFHIMDSFNGTTGVPSNAVSFMYHPVYIENTRYWKWIIFGISPNPSWLEEIDDMCYETYGAPNAAWIYPRKDTIFLSNGKINSAGKEYTTLRDIWIGPRTKIPDIIEFSNLNNKYDGGIVGINNTDYLIVSRHDNNSSAFIMTEEV